MINYTIIIPHYRSINTLRRLLLSIPDRDDIQILVIDDNSNLDKEEFKRLPLFVFAKFSMIFLSENRGAGGARNEGLKIAKGKWLIFADSDDFFLPSAFELCDEYLYSKYDIVYLGIRSVDRRLWIDIKCIIDTLKNMMILQIGRKIILDLDMMFLGGK